MRRILACIAFFGLAAVAHASPSTKAELVTPIQLGLYASDANSGADINLDEPTLNDTAYSVQNSTDIVAFAKLSCTPYTLMMTLSKDVNGKPFITSKFVAVDADAKSFTAPEMTPVGDPNNPTPFIFEKAQKVSSAKSKLGLFTAVAAKGCDYFEQYQLGDKAEVFTLQAQ